MGHRQVGAFGHAIVEHVGRDRDPGFRRQENHPPPALLDHVRHVMPGQAHTGDHVDLIEARPLAVGGVEEIHRFVDPQVVHQDVGPWFGGEQYFRTFGGPEIGSQPAQLSARHLLADARQGLFHLGRIATDHHHRGAGLGQRLADAQADAGRAAADNRQFSTQIDFHAQAPVIGNGARSDNSFASRSACQKVAGITRSRTERV